MTEFLAYAAGIELLCQMVVSNAVWTSDNYAMYSDDWSVRPPGASFSIAIAPEITPYARKVQVVAPTT